jgi:hypothetical protein
VPGRPTGRAASLIDVTKFTPVTTGAEEQFVTDEDEAIAPYPVPSHVEGMRNFSLNSREFYKAVCAPAEPWIRAGSLPREPRGRDLPVVVESRTATRRR